MKSEMIMELGHTDLRALRHIQQHGPVNRKDINVALDIDDMAVLSASLGNMRNANLIARDAHNAYSITTKGLAKLKEYGHSTKAAPRMPSSKPSPQKEESAAVIPVKEESLISKDEREALTAELPIPEEASPAVVLDLFDTSKTIPKGATVVLEHDRVLVGIQGMQFQPRCQDDLDATLRCASFCIGMAEA